MKLIDEYLFGFLFVFVFEQIHFCAEVMNDCHVVVDELVAYFSDRGGFDGGKGKDKFVIMVLLDDVKDNVFDEATAEKW